MTTEDTITISEEATMFGLAEAITRHWTHRMRAFDTKHGHVVRCLDCDVILGETHTKETK